MSINQFICPQTLIMTFGVGPDISQRPYLAGERITYLIKYNIQLIIY